MNEKGYCAMTMNDIAARLGVSKGTLYNYFETKDDLVIEIIKTIHEDVVKTAKEAFPESSPHKIWTLLTDRYMTKESSNNSLYIEATAMATRKKIIRESLSKNMIIWIDIATQNIIDQQNRGLIRPELDARTLAIEIVSIFLGFQNLAVAGIDQKEIHDHWMAMLNTLFP